MAITDDSTLLRKEGVEADGDRAALLKAVSARDLDRVRNAARRILARATSPSRAATLVRGAVQRMPPPGLRPFSVALLSSFSIELV